jgi:hypothetical protein
MSTGDPGSQQGFSRIFLPGLAGAIEVHSSSDIYGTNLLFAGRSKIRGTFVFE